MKKYGEIFRAIKGITLVLLEAWLTFGVFTGRVTIYKFLVGYCLLRISEHSIIHAKEDANVNVHKKQS